MGHDKWNAASGQLTALLSRVSGNVFDDDRVIDNDCNF